MRNVIMIITKIIQTKIPWSKSKTPLTKKIISTHTQMVKSVIMTTRKTTSINPRNNTNKDINMFILMERNAAMTIPKIKYL